MFYFLDMRRAMSGVGKPPLAGGREAKEESSRHTSRESHTGERLLAEPCRDSRQVDYSSPKSHRHAISARTQNQPRWVNLSKSADAIPSAQVDVDLLTVVKSVS